MYEIILIPTDGSDSANRAVEHAVDLASTFDADLHAIYVVDSRRYGSRVVSDADVILEELADRGRRILEELRDRADSEVTIELRRGRPNEEIVAYAGEVDADLIVLGNRGLDASAGAPLGSVAERVVRTAGRPVITA